MYQINKRKKNQAARTKEHFQGDTLQENIFIKLGAKKSSKDFEFEVLSYPRFPEKTPHSFTFLKL